VNNVWHFIVVQVHGDAVSADLHRVVAYLPGRGADDRVHRDEDGQDGAEAGRCQQVVRHRHPPRALCQRPPRPSPLPPGGRVVSDGVLAMVGKSGIFGKNLVDTQSIRIASVTSITYSLGYRATLGEGSTGTYIHDT
jgi:hypothetical protein